MRFCEKCGKLLQSFEEEWCCKCENETVVEVLDLEDDEDS